MRYALRGVRQEERAVAVGRAGHLAQGVDRAQHVAHVGGAHQPRAVGEERLVVFLLQVARVVHGYDLEHDALAVAQQLPGHDVAVVLHDGEDDLVALLEEGLAETGRHEVEALGGAAREDDFGGGAGVDEAPHPLAGGLVEVGGLLREVVHAAVHVGVDGIVFLGDGLHYAPRLLRGGRVVEVNERPAVHLAPEYGEVLAYFF